MDAPHDKPLKFEEAIAELEAIVDQIESGQCGLEECIARYERGVKLVSQCQSILGVVQRRIAELTADGNGKLALRDGPVPADGAGASPPADAPPFDDAVDGQLDEDLPMDERA